MSMVWLSDRINWAKLYTAVWLRSNSVFDFILAQHKCSYLVTVYLVRKRFPNRIPKIRITPRPPPLSERNSNVVHLPHRLILFHHLICPCRRLLITLTMARATPTMVTHQRWSKDVCLTLTSSSSSKGNKVIWRLD